MITISGENDPSYCGYPEENTAYRLSIASFSILFGITYAFRIADENPNIFSAILFVVMIVWTAAVVVDSTTLANSTAACNDGWGDMDNVDCDSSSYGMI